MKIETGYTSKMKFKIQITKIDLVIELLYQVVPKKEKSDNK